MLVPLQFFFVVQAKACSKQTQLYFSLICTVKDVLSFSTCVFILLWFICSCWSSCQGFLWLIQQSSSDWSLPLVYLRSQFEVKRKKEKSIPVFIQALLLMLCFVFNIAFKFFSPFNPFKTKSLVNQRRTVWNTSCKSLIKLTHSVVLHLEGNIHELFISM